MKVALATIGKFHTFDLARQLLRHQALGLLFSGYPWYKVRDQGIPREFVRTFPYLHAPYQRLAGSAPAAAVRLLNFADRLAFDEYTRLRLQPCDIFHWLSGFNMKTAIRARRRFSSLLIVDRGSTHIQWAEDLLRAEYDRLGLPFTPTDSFVIEREQAEYALADAITLPSTVAVQSFLAHGVPAHKLRLSPYGVDVSRFEPLARPPSSEFRVLFVGNLCVRKGVHYLLQAFNDVQHPRKHLDLVGHEALDYASILAPYRNRSDITFHGHLGHKPLNRIMSGSTVLVLASIEEGLALVQAQAMAAGCPIVATTATGAPDLFTSGDEGFIVPPRDASALTAALQQLADQPGLADAMGLAARERVQQLGGWDAYGDQMLEHYNDLLATRTQARHP